MSDLTAFDHSCDRVGHGIGKPDTWCGFQRDAAACCYLGSRVGTVRQPQLVLVVREHDQLAFLSAT